MASEWPVFAFLQPHGSDNFTAFDASPDGTLWDLSCETQPCTYLHRDAARAWQAFRDFLNGNVEQWEKRMDHTFDRGVRQGEIDR